MSKFMLAATDKKTGATLYGRVSPTGNFVAFRTGIAVSDGDQRERIAGLHLTCERATFLDGDVACALLVSETERLANVERSWMRDLRIVVA